MAGRAPFGALLAVLGLAGASALAQAPLPHEIEDLLEADPLPPVSVAPNRRYLLLVHERQLLSRKRLAEPAILLAGRRINPRNAAAHAPLEYFGFTLVDFDRGTETDVPLPRGAVVGYPSWAPDGSRFAFTLTRPEGTELWIGEPSEARARPLVRSINATRGLPCTWTPDSRRLLCRRIEDGGPLARARNGSLREIEGPRTAIDQPVVLDERLTRRLLETQLELIDSVSGQRHSIGPLAAIESVDSAPARAFLLVTRIVEPYPRISDVDPIVRVVEIWDRFGNVLRRLPDGIRAVDWHASRPATVTWVERRDGSDRIMLLPPPYTGSAIEGFALPDSFSGLYWIADTDSALVANYSPELGRTELWHVEFADSAAEPRLVLGYRSASPRSPLMQPNQWGKNAIIEHDGGFYLRGQSQAQPFLDHIAFATGERRNVWVGAPDGYEMLVDLLSADGHALLTRYETDTSPPNYYVKSDSGELLWAITGLEHPTPALAEARRVRLEYSRDDGVDLTASLYLPPGYDGVSRLPLIVWAYPRNVSAGGTKPPASARDRYPTFERAFRLFFLLRGYAVMDDVSMPIVGSDQDANDTFIEQIVANAGAAIGAAEATGFIDATRVGVAGHSYGAFMVANLLAHSRLFSAGVALSGAYNRTLTPFGFQTERRTLWEAPDTYLAMSPLLYSHRIEAPLLLVHGLDDDNAGTSPLQSTQFYAAIRGNGGDAGLLLLPWEGHSYRARESVLDTAVGMLEWFDRHLKEPALDEKETGASLRPLL